MEITIDDVSPQIRYWSRTDTWAAKHVEGELRTSRTSLTTDSQTSRYFGETFYSSRSINDTSAFTFRAEGITVFGAKRNNHGPYTVKLDDGEEQVFDGCAAEPELWQVPIYNATGLSRDEEHTVRFTNLPDDPSKIWFDIDFVILTGPSDETMETHWLDDTDPAFAYSNGWKLGQDKPGENRYNDTKHTTRQKGATADFTFEGVSCQIFGALNTDHSLFSVSLDGSVPMILNGTFFNLTSPVSLFAATGLAQTTHTVRFTNLGEGKKPAFDLDYAVVNSTRLDNMVVTSGSPSLNPVSPVQSVAPATASSSPSTPDAGVIVGCVIGALVGIVIVAAGGYMWFRRGNDRRAARKRRIAAGLSYVPWRDGDTDEAKSRASWTTWMDDGTSRVAPSAWSGAARGSMGSAGIVGTPLGVVRREELAGGSHSGGMIQLGRLQGQA